MCSNPAKPDGTACQDGNSCTVAACNAGVCAGSPLSSFGPGAVVWSTSAPGPSAVTTNASYPGYWSVSKLMIGPMERAFIGASGGAPYGNATNVDATIVAVDGPGASVLLANHSTQSTLPPPASFTVEASSAQHYVTTTLLGSNQNGGNAYIDSDVDTLSFFFMGGQMPHADGNAAGDLLFTWAAGLTRVNASKSTVYTQNFGPNSLIIPVQAGAAGDAYLVGTALFGENLGCGFVSSPGYYAVRLDPGGHCVWSRPVPTGASTPPTYLLGGLYDYLTGPFQGTFDAGCGAMTDTAGGSQLIAAYDPSGACVWSRNLGSASAALLPSGDLLLTGPLTGTLDVGCGPVSSGSSAGSLVALLDPSGACMWNRVLPVSSASVAPIATGDIAVAAPYSGSIDLGTGPLPAAGTQDVAVAQLDGTTGETLFSEHFGGAGATLTGTISADDGGGMLVNGAVTGTADLGGGALTNTGYLLRLDGAGAFRWQRSIASGVLAAYDGCGATTLASIGNVSVSSFPGSGFSDVSVSLLVQRIAP